MDITTLFRWSKEIEIKDIKGAVRSKIYLRLVGDYDYNEAQKRALAESRKLRKLFRDNTSVEYDSLFADIDTLEKENLINSIILYEFNEIRDKVLDEAEPQKTLEDFSDDLEDDATQEDRENVQVKYDDYIKSRVEKLQGKFDEESELKREVLELLSDDVLKKRYIDSSINYRCGQFFSEKFRDYCVYLGTYLDDKFKTRVFKDFSEFLNCSTLLKNQLLEAYTSLTVSGEDLKN